MNDLTIILPTLNEGDNIGYMINSIRQISTDIKIIVADDGSKDSTQEVVKALAKKDKNIKLLDRTNELIK